MIMKAMKQFWDALASGMVAALLQGVCCASAAAGPDTASVIGTANTVPENTLFPREMARLQSAH